MSVCHHTVAPTGYVEWHLWAEEMTRKGYVQEKCPTCGLWSIWRKPKVKP